jgi:IMP cyclohydrolase
MKTIVLLNNIFSGDLIKDYEYLKQNLDMSKFNLVSPLMFMAKDGKYDTDNFTVRLIAASISLGNMYNEFGTIKAIAGANKTTIYYGLAHSNVKKDMVLVVKSAALDTQEYLLDTYLKEASVSFNYIKSSEAKNTFESIEQALEFIHAL